MTTHALYKELDKLLNIIIELVETGEGEEAKMLIRKLVFDLVEKYAEHLSAVLTDISNLNTRIINRFGDIK
jgi:hypothetical protein